MDEASAIRVHNTGAFVMNFYVQRNGDDSSGGSTLLSRNLLVGMSDTIDLYVAGQRGPGTLGSPQNLQVKDEVFPVANIVAGKQGHGASQNVVFRPGTGMTAVYNCGGTTFFPSFDYQGLSSD